MLKYNSPEVAMLRQMLEKQIGFMPQSSTDFERLANKLWNDKHLVISPTTLKRLWGYVKRGDVIRMGTLDTLSAYLGFKDWDELHTSHSLMDSSGEISSYVLKTDKLYIGASVEVTWLPNRRCVFFHQGEGFFRVEVSENSKLQVGDTFHCDYFIPKNQLYLDKLVRQGVELGHYIAGKQGGIEITLL